MYAAGKKFACALINTILYNNTSINVNKAFKLMPLSFLFKIIAAIVELET